METKLCTGLTLTSPLYNASCPVAVTYKQLNEIDQSKSGAILTKSCTLLPNELKIHSKRYEYDLTTHTSYNQNELLNPGLDYYLKYKHKKESKKPYIISVALSDSDDYTKLVKQLNCSSKTFPQSIELNLSCPNHPDQTNSNYYQILADTLDLIEQNTVFMPILGLKLRPCIDISDIDLTVDLVRECPKIKYVVCTNTIPRGMSGSGYIGAIGGRSLKPVSLWNVYEYRRRLSSDIGIVGCGGVFNYNDFDHYIRTGATAVQIGTGIYEHGLDTIDTILDESRRYKMKSNL